MKSEDKFQQVEGFMSFEVPSLLTTCAAVKLPPGCKQYTDPKTGLFYLFSYPDDDTIQYLYETYPRHISPLKGVTDEHFIIWMKTASLPKFRKLYGRVFSDFSVGDVLSFDIEANFEVQSFDGVKAIVISTVGNLGGKNATLGVTFIFIGCLSFVAGIVFGVKHMIKPRQFGDPKLLNWDKKR